MEEEAKRRCRGQPMRIPKTVTTMPVSPTYPISELSPLSIYLVSPASAARRPVTRRTPTATRKQLRLLSHLADAPSAGGSCSSSARQRRQRVRGPPRSALKRPRPPLPARSLGRNQLRAACYARYFLAAHILLAYYASIRFTRYCIL